MELLITILLAGLAVIQILTAMLLVSILNRVEVSATRVERMVKRRTERKLSAIDPDTGRDSWAIQFDAGHTRD